MLFYCYPGLTCYRSLESGGLVSVNGPVKSVWRNLLVCTIVAGGASRHCVVFNVGTWQRIHSLAVHTYPPTQERRGRNLFMCWAEASSEFPYAIACYRTTIEAYRSHIDNRSSLK